MDFREEFRAFDPNAPKVLPWATYIRWRNPAFKMHGARAMALNAFAGWNDLAALYSWDAAAKCWVTVAIKDRDRENCTCSECGGTTIEHGSFRSNQVRLDEAKYGKDAFDVGRYSFERQGGGYRTKLVYPLRFMYQCQACQDLPY